MGVGPAGLRRVCTPPAQAGHGGAAVDVDFLNCWPCKGGEHPRREVLAVLGRLLRAEVSPDGA
eukprot:4315739-Pyramimonas_sp.AAC.1